MNLMDLNHLDYMVFQWINNLAVQALIFNPLMRFLAQDGEYVFYAGMLIYWFIRTAQNRILVAKALLSACIALGVGGVIVQFYDRARPFVNHKVVQLIQHPANASFPSDHATGAFVIAMSIWFAHKKAGTIWLIFASLVAISRVWTGVHYPTDVIAGAFIGLAAAFGVQQLFAHSDWAQRQLAAAIKLYEHFEQKVWARKQTVNSTNS